jgi:hypothetical protein
MTEPRVEPPTSRPPVRLGPWDEPWCKAHRLTRPMFITLYDVEQRGLGGGTVRRMYPGGQWRLIRNGLYTRYLINEDLRLTMAGHVLAIWAGAAIRRAYPARPDEVRTR